MEEITLSGFPNSEAFNPALVRWCGRNLIMYRVGWDNAELYLGELDRDFKVMGEFHKVTVPGVVGCEDARFFIHQNQLHFSFVGFFGQGRHLVGIGQVNDNLTVRDCRIIKGTDPLLNEKNWIFFSHDEQLYFTYALSDGVHQVYRPTDDGCESIYRTYYEDPWKWGVARGGTQLIQHEGLLYGVFHGTDFECEGLEKRFFMGAYAVSPEPPFPIVKMSRNPLYTPTEVRFHPATESSKARRVASVFPLGLILDGHHWLVCAGYNNQAIKVFKIGHEELVSNLISTVPNRRPADEGAMNSFSRRRGRVVRVHWFPLDRFWAQPLEFVAENRGDGEAIFADARMLERLDESQACGKITLERLREGLNWVILHKEYADSLALAALDELQQRYRVVFANEVFVVFTNKVLPGVESDFDPEHERALWIKIEKRKSGAANQKPPRRKEARAGNRFWLSFRKFFLALS